MRKHLLLSSLLPALIAMTACGGGAGSTPTPTPAPAANQAPAFTSPTAASISENATGVAYTATASDADADPVAFSISGRADAGQFTLTASGVLSFKAAPDFEAPADADANNIYLVQIAASDGKTSTVLNLQVTVTNAGPDGFVVRRLRTQPDVVGIFDLPGDDLNLYPISRTGEVRGFRRVLGNSLV